MKNTILLIVVSALLFSCEKEELPVPPRTPGPEIIAQVNMGGDYGQQIFYSLNNNQVVRQNPKTAWDIGLESGAEGWRIFLNSSRGGAAVQLENTDFESINNPTGIEWKWDASSGNADSTAIGDYRESAATIIIDRGFDPAGNHTGYWKMKVIEVTSASYTFRCAEINGAQDTILTVPKSANTNLTAFSFDQLAEAEIEPPSDSWDLLFTQYVHIFYDPVTPYLVTGVIINRYQTTVAEVSDRNFDELALEHAEEYQFSNALDIIGYDWKTFDFASANFIIHPEKIYLINDSEGRYFKLKFIDFYTESGQRGAPRFEMQEL